MPTSSRVRLRRRADPVRAVIALLVAAAAPAAPLAAQTIEETAEEMAEEADQQEYEEPAELSEPLDRRLGLAISERVGTWSHDRDLNDQTIVPVAGVRAKLAPRMGNLDIGVEGFVQVDRVGGVESDLVEGWARLRLGALDLVAGRRIIVWGRADRLNPTDIISSRDYTLLVASDDEQRRGSVVAQARLGLGNFTLDALWLPEFRGIRFPLRQDRPGLVILPDEEVQDRGQFGLRLDRSGGSVDWSVSWFHGVDRTRDFALEAAPAGSPPGTVAGLRQVFPRLDLFGADAAGTIGKIGWRVEAAWSRYRGEDTPLRRRDNLWVVAGADRDFGPWNLNLQYSWRRQFDWQDPATVGGSPAFVAIAQLGAAVNNQLNRVQHGLTARVARQWRSDTIDTELATIVFFPTGDAAIRPRASIAINDSVRLSVGADVFVGPRLSFFGQVRSLSAAFVQLNHGF